MAGAFHFSLQKVLDYRRQLEEQARQDLAHSKSERDRQAKFVADLESRLEIHSRSLPEKGPYEQSELWLWKQYGDGLSQDLNDGRKHLARMEEVVDRNRDRAVASSRDRKLLERLKSRKLLEHNEEEKKQEQMQFDEMATLRYQNKSF